MVKYSLTHPSDKALEALKEIDKDDLKGRTGIVGKFLEECGAFGFQIKYFSAAELYVNCKEPLPEDTIGRIKEYCDIEEVK